MPAKSVLVLAAAASVAFATPAAEAANPWTPVPSSFFGMHIFHTYDWPSVSVGGIGKGSCVDWMYVEPSRGSYHWTTLDSYVSLTQQKGVDLVYTFDGVPSWAASNKANCHPSGCSNSIQMCQSMPANMQDFTNYVTALVTRYKGRIKNYELWNEPYRETGLSISNMVTLTSAAYNVIRSIDPGATIITPSMDASSPQTVNYAANYFAQGGPTGVDVASIHAYPDVTSKTADVPEAVSPNRYLLGPILPVLSKYLPNKPLWDTEGSWNTDNVGNFVSASDQAAFIARWYLIQWSSGLRRVYWYAWDNSILGTMMPSMRGSSIPATAYQQIQNWMIGRSMSTPCTVQKNGTTWTCGLSGPDGYQGQVVWNTTGNASYVPPSPSIYHQKRDLSGNVSYYAGSSGAAVTVGTAPILLEN